MTYSYDADPVLSREAELIQRFGERNARIFLAREKQRQDYLDMERDAAIQRQSRVFMKTPKVITREYGKMHVIHEGLAYSKAYGETMRQRWERLESLPVEKRNTPEELAATAVLF